MSCENRSYMEFYKEFKTFARRGHVLELAIGVILGTAFNNVILSLIDDIVTPPLGLLIGGVDFVNLTVKMNNFIHQNEPPVVIRYGKFIQTIFTLTIVALVLFFVVKAINRLHRITIRNHDSYEEIDDSERYQEIQILREIRDILSQQSSTKLS